MPDGGIQVAFVLADDAHADMGDKIIRDRGKDALKDIGGVTVALGFEVGFAQQPVGFNVAGVGLEDGAAVRDGLVDMAVFDQIGDLSGVFSQCNLSHFYRCS
jgi:hypothetical protein